jgi:hypothetical protein
VVGDTAGQIHQSIYAIGANTNAANIFIRKTRAASPATQTIVSSTDSIGGILFQGSDGTAYKYVAAIQAEMDGAPGANDMPGRLVIKTTPDGSASPAERVRIDNKGNVIVNNAAIATNATDGFLYVPTCAGTPSGTPTAYSGRAPIVINTTNNKLYFYSTGAWRDAGP